MSSFWIGSILFSAHFLMVVLVFLHPVISQLVFLLHILSLIIQEKASDAFTFLFLPSPPLGTKVCQKRDCQFIVVTLSEQNKFSLHILSSALVRRYSHLCSEKSFVVMLFIPCYIITQVILAFWLVLAYDLLKERCIDDDSARFKFFLTFLNFEFEPTTILY